MDKLTFYRGLLYALAIERPDFVAEGDGFHRAFAATVEHARRTTPGKSACVPKIHLDPMFGVYHEANEMLLEGEQDLLISLLNPRHRKASFRISKDAAQAELKELPEEQWFKGLGQFFHAQLQQ